MGVEIFFVLSGFLITGILLKEHRKSGTFTLSDFYTRRAFRIFPTFYVCWILTSAGILISKTPIEGWSAAASFFYLTDYARAIAGDAVAKHMGISWSLGIEEQFYLLWPLILRWTLNRGRSAMALAGGIALFVWVYRAVLMFGFGVPVGYIYNAFDTRLDALMIGSLLAVAVDQARAHPALLITLRSPWLTAVPISALALPVIFTQAVHAQLWHWLLSLTIQPVLIAIALIQIVYWGWSFLQHPAVRYVARISYGLYLYHAFSMAQMGRVPWEHNKRLAALGMTMVLSVLSYHFIEKPFMRMRDGNRLKAASAKTEY